jgi:hypothetical protein
MNIQSAKSKGRRLAQRVALAIRTLFKLNEDDVYNTPGGVPGEDIKLSEVARKLVPFSIECKNTEKLNIWDALKQAENQNRKYKPLLIFSRNRSDDYCALKFNDFLLILKKISDLEEANIYESKAGSSL